MIMCISMCTEARDWHWIYSSLHLIYFYLIIIYFILFYLREGVSLSLKCTDWLNWVSIKAGTYASYFVVPSPPSSGSRVINVHPTAAFVVLRI